MTKYILGILGLGWVMFPITVVLGMAFAALWIIGGGYALIVGVAAIPKYSVAIRANDQLAIVRLRSEIELIATSPFFLAAGGYIAVRMLMTVM